MAEFRLWRDGKYLARKTFWRSFLQTLAYMQEDFSADEEDDEQDERPFCAASYRGERFKITAFDGEALIPPEDTVICLNRLGKKSLCAQRIELADEWVRVWFVEEGKEENIYKVELSRVLSSIEEWD